MPEMTCEICGKTIYYLCSIHGVAVSMCPACATEQQEKRDDEAESHGIDMDDGEDV